MKQVSTLFFKDSPYSYWYSYSCFMYSWIDLVTSKSSKSRLCPHTISYCNWYVCFSDPVFRCILSGI